MSARVMLMVRCKHQKGMIPQTLAEAFKCDDWWLVESHDVDSARKAIEHFERDPNATCVHGRVLEHGGGK